MISKELLAKLACPVCKTKVELTLNQDGLRCTKCRRIYPLVDDIPVMLVEEARTEGAA